MKKLTACALLLVISAPVFAWNEKGHYVVCRLAWNRLTEQQRARVSSILHKHPHYEEFLLAQKPDGFTNDEWAFMRAGSWSDWVRNHHTNEFNRGTWHYINYPFVPPGSSLDAAKLQPPPDQQNVVNVLTTCIEKIKNGSDTEKAVYLCWLCHLTGDIHQPLHCTAMFSEAYPKGDQGGNLVAIRISSSPVKLHAFWDGLLGTGRTIGAIGKDVREIEKALTDKADTIQPELDQHKTFESWGREGFELAKKAVYLDGDLKLGRSSGRNTLGDNAPQAPADYAPASGRTARVQIGKAGVRLAGQLLKLFP